VALGSGKAAVAVITSEFDNFATELGARAGRSKMRRLSLPHPLATKSEEHVREVARDSYGRLLRTIGL
jgi:hypothetical protein